MYDVDFGVGRPVRCGVPCDVFNGLAYILPTANDTGKELVIGLCDDVMQRFVQHSLISSYTSVI